MYTPLCIHHLKLSFAIVIWIIFGRLKTLLMSSKNADAKLSGFSSIFFRFNYLIPSLPHDLIREKVLSLVKLCSTERQNCTSVLQIRRVFSNKKYDSYKCWTCTEFSDDFILLMKNIYVKFEGMVCQQIIRIPLDTNRDPFKADLFWNCYEMDFMSNLQKSERFELIDKLNDTSRYLGIAFTIWLITLNLLSIFLIYIQENFSWIKQILRTKKNLSWI